MATFKDKTGQTWSVSLDPIVIQEINQKHGVMLTDLEKDPMQKLRGDVFLLVSIIHLICQEQIQTAAITPDAFAKRLPFPPDPMLVAVEEAIVDFFPTGRASHVREVLANYEKMSQKVDEMQRSKMQQLIENKQVETKINEEADRRITAALDDLFQVKKQDGSATAVAS